MAMEMMSKQHDVEISELRSRVEEENENNMGLTIYLEGGYVTFFRRRNVFFRCHRNHIFLLLSVKLAKIN
jgi:hypothetical protein